jgi:NTP pyrophosphatase (non-canonical NTP hydrolase)
MELTETEKNFDTRLAAFIEARRKKGRETYGQGLEHGDNFDWDIMALEEVTDFAQYLMAENTRLRETLRSQSQVLLADAQETFGWYQNMAMRTARADEEPEKALLIRTLGLTGEAGEVADYVKKCAGHGHPLDKSVIEKELGDVLWYVAALSHNLGLDMAGIARKNIDKLKKRYPEGFSEEASRNRVA